MCKKLLDDTIRLLPWKLRWNTLDKSNPILDTRREFPKWLHNIIPNILPQFTTRLVAGFYPQPNFWWTLGLLSYFGGLFVGWVFHQFGDDLLDVAFNHLLLAIDDGTDEVIAFCDKPVLHINGSFVPIDDSRCDVVEGE